MSIVQERCVGHFNFDLTSNDDALLLGRVVKVSDEIGDVVVIVVVVVSALTAVLLLLVVVVAAAGRRRARYVRGELLQMRQRLGAELVQDSCEIVKSNFTSESLHDIYGILTKIYAFVQARRMQPPNSIKSSNDFTG